MIQKLRVLVDKILSQNKDKHMQEKLVIIKEILKDENCFFKIDYTTAFSILNDLGFSKEETKKIYKELISSNNNKKEA